MQYGEMDEGVVYPGKLKVTVALDVKNNNCSELTSADTSCTAFITNDANYTIILTLSNDVGASEPVTMVFDCEFLYP